MSARTKIKPEYKIPSMKDVDSVSYNGYNVISTFSGAGGSSLGYRWAGFNVLWANELIHAAQKVYETNHPTTYLDKRDIRQISADEIFEATNTKKGEIDILDGSPPCASFSTSGTLEKSWNKVRNYSGIKQRVDDLFFEYIRIVEEVQPKVFIAENVSGLIKGVSKGYFKEILSSMKSKGYQVRAKLLDAQWLEVPQKRQRVFFVGVRNDLDIAPAFPEPKPYRYFVNEVMPHISMLKLGGMPDNWKSSYRPSGTIVQSDGKRSNQSAYKSHYLIKTRDNEVRKYTIEELKILFSFPEDFILTGTYADQWERIARSVPPRMMYHIASTIKSEVLEKYEHR